MAYIHKATVYFIDVSEGFESVKEILEEVKCYDGLPNMKLGVDYGTKEFEWDDNVAVNKLNCSPEQCEQFFQNPPPKIIKEYFWFRVITTETSIVDIKPLAPGVKHLAGVVNTATADRLTGESKPVYYLDVEASSVEEAKEIAKNKVIDHITGLYRKEMQKIRDLK